MLKPDPSAPWLSTLKQVSDASEASCIRALLTCDGAGVEVKAAALKKLLHESVSHHLKNT